MKHCRLFFLFILPFLTWPVAVAQKPVRPAANQCIQIESCSKIDSLLQLALSKKGCAYGRAGSGPNVFDCSGFTMWVYKQFGVDLPHGSVPQYAIGKKVERNDIRPGDLVFFYRSRCIGHVGLVTDVDSAGNVTFIHASTYKTGVKLDRLESNWYAKTFVGTRRIFECADVSYPRSEAPVEASIEPISRPQADTAKQEQPTAKPDTTVVVYIVAQGDNLFKLAQRYGVTIAEIQQWNNLPSPDKISIGQKLKIYSSGTHVATTPQNKPSQPVAQPVYHKVKKGENLGVIARKYHTTVSKLQKLNKMGNSDFLREGQRLRVR